MSVSATLDVSLSSKGNNLFSSVDIIKIFIENGWFISDNGKFFYLPLGDNDDFDWQDDEMDQNEFIEIIKQKEEKEELIGIAITWKKSSIGGTLLVYPDKKLSLNLCINRKTLDNIESRITDVNWYLEKILPLFETDNITVDNFAFIQC